jgi:multidrug efflux system outer membrane protein
MRDRSRFARTMMPIALASILAGCMVGPDYQPPVPEADAQFAGQTLVETTPGTPEQDWWKVFGDPLLDELIDQAQTSNLSLAAAEARLREARASRREEQWEFVPVPTGRASATRRRNSLGGQPGNVPVEREYDLYDASFDAAWELDLFGRVRRGNEAARAELGAAVASRDDVRLSMKAEVARNYFELRGAQQQLQVAERNAENQQRALELVEARLDAGRGTALDTARAQAQIETTRATVPPLEAAVDRSRRRIEVLVGQRPGQLTEKLAPVKQLPALPATLTIDDPVSLLRRRPDLRIAERRLASTSALIGVATADLFPTISLNGTIGLQALHFNALDDPGNDYSRFGPSLTWSFLDIGRIRQRIKAAGARHEEAFANYEQTVLLALEDVENALSDYGRERRRLEHLSAAAAASVLASDLAEQRFEGGIADFLTALDAYRTALEAEDSLAQSRTAAATALVALYKALGVGITGPEPAK